MLIRFEDWKVKLNVSECKSGIAKFKVEPPKFSGQIRDFFVMVKTL